MIKKTQNKTNVATQAIEFLKKYWLFITALLIGIPYLKRYMDEQAEKTRQAKLQLQVEGKIANAQVIVDNRQTENQNPLTQAQKRLKITASKELHAASQKLASDFGFLQQAKLVNWYDYLNPLNIQTVAGTLSENDIAIRETLVLYRNYFDKLEKLYYEVDTNSRSLRKDILQYLDSKELKYLRKYLKI
ncbi:DUF1110 domain-containing protein [Flavobacterium sp. ZB4P13]|uniref:DUF1110 domain-containing protein n=1 Tax=Flavobacterium sp. ZB4P13 TaxID=3401728 RepID=UPI003AACBAB6